MRPTSIASAGQGEGASRAMGGDARKRRLGGALRLLDQARDRRRELRAVAGPVLDAVEEAAIAAQARVGDDDVEEGALLRAAAGQPDDDHERVLGCGSVPAKNRA